MQSSIETPQFILLQGKVDFNRYQTECTNANVSLTNTVFIFPGNIGHHLKEHTLYTIKTGLGLATAAKELGMKGIPTLSLPTTAMPIIKPGTINITAQQAIADLWKAVGYGCSFVLPIRKKAGRFNNDQNLIPSDKYFGTEGLGQDNQFEPRFWGLNEPNPNIELGKYYLTQLKLLINFIDNPDQQPPAEFQEAFREGQLAQICNKPWFSALEPIHRPSTSYNEEDALLGNRDDGNCWSKCIIS